MQQLFPPSADDVFGDEDGDDVAGAVSAHSADVVEEGSGDLPEGRVEDDEGDANFVRAPLLQQPGGVVVVDLDGDRIQGGGPGCFGVGDGAQGG